MPKFEKGGRQGQDNQNRRSESPEAIVRQTALEMGASLNGLRHTFENDDGSIKIAHEGESTGSFNSIEEVNKWHVKEVNEYRAEKGILLDALAYVERTVLPNDKPTRELIGRMGGSWAYVGNLVLERVADVATSVDQMNSILQDFAIFFHDVAGFERFPNKVRRRVGSDNVREEKPQPKRGWLGKIFGSGE